MKETRHDGSLVVAIDGPAGAGKSSVSRWAASELGYAFLDTGAMYRAATWRALSLNLNLDDPEAMTKNTREMNFNLRETDSGLQILVDGTDVTTAIRDMEVTRNIYKLDQVSGVRRCLVELQREYGCLRPTVAEGRDMGTVVFPNARCKIYLDASIECRARRRARELEEHGISVSLQELMAEIKDRDEKSMTRADSPLRRADDAFLVDTTHLSFEEVVMRLVALARERL